MILADLGISKDLIYKEITVSIAAKGDIRTRIYCAPEVLGEMAKGVMRLV